MEYVLTEKEINDNSWWENYAKLKGIDFYATIKHDVKVTFTEIEYNQLRGIKPIPKKPTLNSEQIILKEAMLKFHEDGNYMSLFIRVKEVLCLEDGLDWEQVNDVINSFYDKTYR